VSDPPQAMRPTPSVPSQVLQPLTLQPPHTSLSVLSATGALLMMAAMLAHALSSAALDKPGFSSSSKHAWGGQVGGVAKCGPRIEARVGQCACTACTACTHEWKACRCSSTHKCNTHTRTHTTYTHMRTWNSRCSPASLSAHSMQPKGSTTPGAVRKRPFLALAIRSSSPHFAACVCVCMYVRVRVCVCADWCWHSRWAAAVVAPDRPTYVPTLCPAL